MNNSGKWVLGVIVVIVILLIIILPGKKGGDIEEGPIKFGLIGPLTGDASAYGADTLSAAEMAVEEINEAGGINGRPIELISEDGKCSAKDGLSSAQKLINVDKVKFIVSSSCSGELLGYTNLAEQNKILVLNTLASSPKVTEAGDYIFRNDPSDNDGGKQLADLVRKSYTRVAVVTENTEFAEGIREVFVNTFEANGGEIVADESFAPENTDFRAILLKVKDTNPEAIFLNPQAPANAARLAKQARDLGITSQFYVVYMSGPEYHASGPAVEGSFIIDVPGFAKGNGDVLLQKFKDQYNREPGYPYFVGATYDAVYILAQAIEEVGADTAKVKEYLYEMPEYDGTIGKYRFDENGDLVGINYLIKKVVNQKNVLVEN